MKRYFLLLDLGTGSIRCAAFDTRANRIGKIIQQRLNLIVDEPGQAEHSSDRILNALYKIIRQTCLTNGIEKKEIEALCISTYFHSVMLLDKHYNPLTNILTWADERSSNIASRLRECDSTLKFYKISGCRFHQTFPTAKIIWLRKQYPEVFKKVRYISSAKDFLIKNLTGEFAIDFSAASASGFFNIRTLDWEEEILKLCGISRAMLPSLVPPEYVFDKLSTGAAEKAGLKIETKVLIGAGDAALSNIGTAPFGDIVVMGGTSGAVRRLVDKPFFEPKGRLFCYYAAGGKYISGGAVNAGASVLTFMAKLMGVRDERELIDMVGLEKSLKPSSVTILPFFAGERCPNWLSNAEGVIYGLKLTTSREEVVSSAIDSICYSLRSIYECIPGRKNLKVIATGGLSNSKIWLNKLAGILGIDILVPSNAEGSLLGLKRMAESIFLKGSVSNKDSPISIKEVIKPHNIERFEQGYRKYNRIYSKFNGEWI